MAIALVGNPNSGKTTLFNALTGGRAHTGNWPGVTVDKREGSLRLGDAEHSLVDLPGIYSLDPDTAEQVVARDYLIRDDVKLIINVIDSGTLERSLILTLQLIKLGKPMILALNMMDELEARGASVDTARLGAMLGAQAVGVSAAKGRNLEALTRLIGPAMQAGPSHSACPSCAGCMGEQLGCVGEQWPQAMTSRLKTATSPGCTKCGIGLKDDDIAGIVAQTYLQSGKKTRDITERIDRIVLSKWLSLPILLLVMLAVFYLTFEAAGWLSGLISDFLDGLVSPGLLALMQSAGASEALTSLVGEGIVSGVGSVLAFLPQIAALFFLTSLLEDSGYMARAAFIVDRALSRVGLGGSAVMPLLMGFGCSVPAVMACRALPSEKERRLAIMLVPFFSCSARLPVYALLAGAFFAHNQGLVILSVYVLGVIVAAAAGAILNRTAFRGQDSAFVMEIPPYRIPSMRNLLLHAWERVRGFLAKAGTVLLGASLVIWALQYFDGQFQPAADPANSLLSIIGRAVAPAFAPIGLNDWRAAVSFLTGIFAKEAIVSTLGVLTGGAEGMAEALQGIFTPLQAYVFMVFSLLYIPCASTIVTIKKEMNSWKYTIYTILLGLGTAYGICFVIYNLGRVLSI